MHCSVLLAPLVVAAAAAAACPCADPALCAPLTTPPRPEVVGFSVDATNWARYPLDVVTTVVNFAGALDAQVICRAHAAGVRVQLPAPYAAGQLHNASYRAAFVAGLVALVADGYFDGVNFDFEDPLAGGSDADALTAVIAATATALHASNPALVVSVDVAWSPNCIDLRCYDYPGIAAAADWLFVMAYDMRSQVFWPAPCVASANAPLPLVAAGMGNWTGGLVDVPPSKLVLGVPWYGYVYTCIGGAQPGDSWCPIERVTWRGVNCSDAVGRELSYADVRSLLAHNASRPRAFNDTLASPFFNTVARDGSVQQIWYDDPDSLRLKYDLARAAGWAGVGTWNLDTLDYASRDPAVAEETAAMWAAIATFRRVDAASAEPTLAASRAASGAT